MSGEPRDFRTARGEAGGEPRRASLTGTGHDAAVVTSIGPHRDDVLLGKVLRVRARLGLITRAKATSTFATELRLLDEVIEELMNDD